jgi:hypothetical protein
MKLNEYWRHPFPWIMLLIFLYIVLYLAYAITVEKPKKERAVYSIDIHDGDSVVIYKNHYKK